MSNGGGATAGILAARRREAMAQCSSLRVRRILGTSSARSRVGSNTMRRLWNTFLKGLAAVLPLALTIYVVFWLAKTAESVLGGPVQALLPEDRYWPGLGLLAAFLLI